MPRPCDSASRLPRSRTPASSAASSAPRTRSCAPASEACGIASPAVPRGAPRPPAGARESSVGRDVACGWTNAMVARPLPPHLSQVAKLALQSVGDLHEHAPRLVNPLAALAGDARVAESEEKDGLPVQLVGIEAGKGHAAVARRAPAVDLVLLRDDAHERARRKRIGRLQPVDARGEQPPLLEIEPLARGRELHFEMIGRTDRAAEVHRRAGSDARAGVVDLLAGYAVDADCRQPPARRGGQVELDGVAIEQL